MADKRVRVTVRTVPARPEYDLPEEVYYTWDVLKGHSTADGEPGPDQFDMTVPDTRLTGWKSYANRRTGLGTMIIDDYGAVHDEFPPGGETHEQAREHYRKRKNSAATNGMKWLRR